MTTTNERGWSPYQEAIFAEVKSGSAHLAVNARAGSGKTTTVLEALRHVPPGMSVLFCAFNKAIADELASRAPSGVEVSTLHSYGLKAVTRAFGRLKIESRRADGLARYIAGHAKESWELRSALVKTASLCKATLSRTPDEIDALIDSYGVEVPLEAPPFVTDDPKVSDDYPDPSLAAPKGIEEAPRTRFVRGVRILLALSQDTADGEIDFDDMIWLPVVKNLPVVKYDRVFVDETQDLNACQIKLVLGAVKKGGRICAVGDPMQCHPPGTMVEVAPGEEVPIEELADGDVVRGWNRNAQKMVGGRRVRVASRHFNGKLRVIRAARRDVEVTPNHRLICRWADRSTTTCVTYLMWRKGYGFRVGWCQLFATGGGKNKRTGKWRTFHLAHRARIEKADKTWILKVHPTRAAASVYESIIAARYGIPTAQYEPVYGAVHYTRENLKSIFKAVVETNGAAGRDALRDHDRDFDFPLYPWPGHKRTDLQGRRTYFEVYGANMMPGLMAIPLPDGPNKWATVERVETVRYAGPVYSLDVEQDHSYAANGLVVLNCIYGFRGAAAGAFEKVVESLDAKVLPLSVTYRCARAIVAVANEIVPDLEAAPGAEEGVVRDVTFEACARGAAPGDFVLSRTNAPLVGLCLRMLREGRRAHIQGRDIGAGLKAFVKKSGAFNVEALRRHVVTWRDAEVTRLKEKGRSSDAVEDKALTLLALSDGASSVDDVASRIDRLFEDSDDKARVVLSTTHKAKGLERDRVWMLADTYRRRPGKEEDNLYYVAATRARRELVMVYGSSKDPSPEVA